MDFDPAKNDARIAELVALCDDGVFLFTTTPTLRWYVEHPLARAFQPPQDAPRVLLTWMGIYQRRRLSQSLVAAVAVVGQATAGFLESAKDAIGVVDLKRGAAGELTPGIKRQ